LGERKYFFGNFNLHYFFFSLFYFKIWKFSHFFSCIPRNWGAMIFGTSVALLSSVFLPREWGKALGYNFAAVYLGISFGPFWGEFLTKNF
jgi:predicted MFS family arabinose efflux permease